MVRKSITGCRRVSIQHYRATPKILSRFVIGATRESAKARRYLLIAQASDLSRIPYERPAYGNFSVEVNGSRVLLFNKNPVQQTRLNNLDCLLKLTSRWSVEYKSQTDNYLRQLAGQVRRQKIKPTTEDVLEAIQEWLEGIEAEKTKMPHSIIRRVVLRRVSDTESPDFYAWLQHAEDAQQ
jgi:hypothetical protein